MPKNSILRYNNIFNTFKKKGPSTPFLLFIGEEDYLKKVGVMRIEEYLGVKRHSFFADDTTVNDISKEILNTGLFISKKLIVIYEFEKLRQKDDIFRIHPPQGTYIVLWISSTLNKKKTMELVKRYENLKHLKVYEFSSLDEAGFKLWVKSRLEKNGKKADDKILKYLFKRLPQNLQLADIELNKLFLYMGDDVYLDMHHLDILSYNIESALQNVLFDIMGYEKFNLKKIMETILDRKTNEVIYEMQTHYVRIIDAHLDTFFSDKYRAKWRIKPYKKNKMLHTLKDASYILSRLLRIEYATKTSLHNEKIVKNYLIFSLLP